MKAKIAEIFDSIQGEGLYLGERHVFVRFFGCNLQCRYCDTPLVNFTEYDPPALLEEVKKFRRPNGVISLTGGEPLVQKDFLKEFLPLAQKNNYKIYLDTNGTLPEALAEVIDSLNVVAMDVKLPGSTGLGPFWDKHCAFLKVAQKKDVFVKAVICETTQDADIHALICMVEDSHQAVSLVIQPDNSADPDALKTKIEKYVSWCTSEGIATCYIPQMHKMMGIR
ncbi:MAG TPA: 7-carboxy-7-deazaguanine synthase QueE [Candidatus Omnitrophota bacterium]|nr:7-carboxy-7-deazaguanine synthase QueE [Candidatus Omnitrophota bacterium]HNQ50577.1 7-carboxy-7-deazaguanine synthase QueE [Candidatus Omnitrophota bacterium]HQO37522.1 7-carboxy-7-deazaguanine synthase QueE [Candidatus Omnitrophota bacterium]